MPPGKWGTVQFRPHQAYHVPGRMDIADMMGQSSFELCREYEIKPSEVKVFCEEDIRTLGWRVAIEYRGYRANAVMPKEQVEDHGVRAAQNTMEMLFKMLLLKIDEEATEKVRRSANVAKIEEFKGVRVIRLKKKFSKANMIEGQDSPTSDERPKWMNTHHKHYGGE